MTRVKRSIFSLRKKLGLTSLLEAPPGEAEKRLNETSRIPIRTVHKGLELWIEFFKTDKKKADIL